MKDFNQRFTRILNRFPIDTKSHDSISTDYYTFVLPTSISQFVKRAIRQPLLENFEEDIIVVEYLRVVGVIKDDQSTKDSNDVS